MAVSAAGFGALLGAAVCLPAAASDYKTLALLEERAATVDSSTTTGRATPDPAPAADWKALLVGGNHLIDSYNNAATDLAARLRQSGVQRVAVLQSLGPTTAEGVPTARRREMRRALKALGSTAKDVCLVFVTSHANQRGIYLSADRGYLTARELSSMIDDDCGQRPTVLILSGCDTGAFITSGLTADNRIILAASARGRVSYGAATTDRYVNFDRCMIRAMDEGARTWRELFDRTVPCVDRREARLGVAPSQPQAWFGAQVAHLALPGRH
ncbi:MAG: hypothetical protein KIT36_22135 [Alphaproteobacteria bacterium]|nr:hypothetical protein [Alphaproteobacteria bacterium]